MTHAEAAATLSLLRPEAPSRSRATLLGERLRQLRVARGLTQGELGADRVTKEYISQIERGKARPTAELVAWLAERLEVDPHYLEHGTTSRDYDHTEAKIAQAEAAAASGEWAQAVEMLAGVAHSPEAPELELRALLAESWAQMYVGDVRRSLELLARSREITVSAVFTDVDRAEVLFRTGVCRYKLSSISTAVALFAEALSLAEGSGLPCDRLRSDVLTWRSRCYRRQRDWQAAREDIERALELAELLDDTRSTAHAYFQASIVSERSGNWVAARKYAERAKGLYEAVNDRQSVGRMLNNLGGLNFLLGRSDDAVTYLKDAFAVALEVGSEVDAGQAVSSLAQVHLRTGEAELSEGQARHALELLAGREDFLDEIGNAQVVLGRSLLEQGRLDEAETTFAAAEDTMSKLSSASHRALVWTAQGDLASVRGDDAAAAVLYRRAAEALQDVRF
jgi:tetratricopeptide (TPR) repeat protein